MTKIRGCFFLGNFCLKKTKWINSTKKIILKKDGFTSAFDCTFPKRHLASVKVKHFIELSVYKNTTQKLDYIEVSV